MDTISVIIPVYNVEPYIRQCLDSVVHQTYKNLEIIIVDDGSPDNCGAICDEYAANDERIQVIHKENGGLASARNTGIEYASGEWIAFVDSDDWCKTDYYEQLMSHMCKDPVDIFWAGGCYRERPDRQIVKRTIDAPFVYREMDLNDRSVFIEKILCFGPPWEKIFRRSFLNEYQLRFDSSDKANEDVWFNFITHYNAGSIAGYPYIGYHWRFIPTSITKGYNPQKAEICYRLIQKCHDYLNGRETNERIYNALKCRCLIQISSTLQCSLFHPNCRMTNTEKKKRISEIKQWQYYEEAINDDIVNGLSFKMCVLRSLLRLPWLWPMKLAYHIKNMLLHKRINNGVCN